VMIVLCRNRCIHFGVNTVLKFVSGIVRATWDVAKLISICGPGTFPRGCVGIRVLARW
jgi:hypothetical protein